MDLRSNSHAQDLALSFSDSEQTIAQVEFPALQFHQLSKLAIVHSLAVFLLSGLAEIGGGWLIWRSLRAGDPVWMGCIGGLILVLYGGISTLHPKQLEFGRVYAAYGGYFISLSILWGCVVDRGLVLDAGDILGGLLSIAGGCVICFWPRRG